MTHPTNEELDALVARLLDGPSRVYRDIAAGKSAAAALTALRAQLAAANARATLQPAPTVTTGWPTEEGEGSIIVGNVKGDTP